MLWEVYLYVNYPSFVRVKQAQTDTKLTISLTSDLNNDFLKAFDIFTESMNWSIKALDFQFYLLKYFFY